MCLQWVFVNIYYKKFFFEAVKLPKNTDHDMYSYSGYGNSFDIPGKFFIATWWVW